MQTFLPYADYNYSASALDYKRLGKQRVEAKQIFGALERTEGGWVNHPAVTMWRSYEYSLALYGIAICEEWIARGYNDNLLPFFYETAEYYSGFSMDDPHWLGIEQFHISHQSNLIRKDFDYYSPQFPGITNDIEYWWPTKEMIYV
jgi:Pyrimidine dimer DNA glycosylase